MQVILKYRFPVHIITKSDLVMRDLELLKEINESAILPDDLEGQLLHKVFVTFSFSTVDSVIAKIFEPGAPSPTTRLQTLQTVLENGICSGVSLMPLIPYITDTAEHLERMFTIFSQARVKYIFPSTITLFGNGPADSRTLMFRAITKHYPHLSDKYNQLLGKSNFLPAYYNKAFKQKVIDLCQKYGLKDRLL